MRQQEDKQVFERKMSGHYQARASATISNSFTPPPPNGAQDKCCCCSREVASSAHQDYQSDLQNCESSPTLARTLRQTKTTTGGAEKTPLTTTITTTTVGRDRSRPLNGQRVAVMQCPPERDVPGAVDKVCCSGGNHAKSDPREGSPEATAAQEPLRVCDRWFSRPRDSVESWRIDTSSKSSTPPRKLKSQMPPTSAIAQLITRFKFFSSYQSPSSLLVLLFTLIHLILAHNLTSASLISTITSGTNNNNLINQSNKLPPKGLASNHHHHHHHHNENLEGNKLARQILTNHYQNQILSHIQSQVAAVEAAAAAAANNKVSNPEQGAQHQATTNSWPPYQQNNDQVFPPQHQSYISLENIKHPEVTSEPSPWTTTHNIEGQQQARQQQQTYPEPPVNQPHAPSSQSPGHLAAAPTGQQQPTTPTLNKQIVPPPLPYYELMPTHVVQLESIASSGINNNNRHVTSPMSMMMMSGSSGQNVGVARPPHHHHQVMQAAESVVTSSQVSPRSPSNSTGTSVGSNRDSRSMVQPAEEALGKSNEQPPEWGSGGDQQAQDQAGSVSTSNSQNSDSKFDNNNHNSDQGIEPRQRRRMFNRILKKAEWNYLFVELSKVFLRYFLDLALKDIIGKERGSLGSGSSSSSSSSSSSGDSTTGRKKLDSEFADMFKELVKTAISNLR